MFITSENKHMNSEKNNWKVQTKFSGLVVTKIFIIDQRTKIPKGDSFITVEVSIEKIGGSWTSSRNEKGKLYLST